MQEGRKKNITSHLTHHTPQTSHLKPQTPHLTPHTSHTTPHTLTPHTSHPTPHTLFLADFNSFPPGTCFKRVIVGHSTAFSVSYFLPLRGSILRRFRDQHAAHFGLTDMYPKAAADHPRHQRSQQRHVINLYAEQLHTHIQNCNTLLQLLQDQRLDRGGLAASLRVPPSINTTLFGMILMDLTGTCAIQQHFPYFNYRFA